jgi:hypothetical protein
MASKTTEAVAVRTETREIEINHPVEGGDRQLGEVIVYNTQPATIIVQVVNQRIGAQDPLTGRTDALCRDVETIELPMGFTRVNRAAWEAACKRPATQKLLDLQVLVPVMKGNRDGGAEARIRSIKDALKEGVAPYKPLDLFTVWSERPRDQTDGIRVNGDMQEVQVKQHTTREDLGVDVLAG